jgi:putative membrane protein
VIQRSSVSIACMLAVALTAGCARVVVETPVATFPAGTAFTNAQVVGVVIAANQGEIDTSEPAVERATNEAVREFAQRMVTDHAAANQRLEALGIATAQHDLREQLETSARQTTQALQQYPRGAAYDRAYMDAQIRLHEYKLNSLDNFLIPSATNAALRQELQQMRTSVNAHLTQAREVRQALGGS